MKTSFILPMFGVAALTLTGCTPQPPTPVYVSVNGMTVPKRCVAYVVYQGTSVKVNTSGGAGGITIALGGEITPAVLQRATGTLQIIDAARMQCCEGAREAAYANEHARYNRYRNLEEQNTKKLIQFAQIAVGQPTANVPPVEPAPKVGESAGAKPTPKPAVVIGKKQVPKVHKWLSAYEPKAEERVIVTGSLIPTGPAASAVPGVPAETGNKKAVMDVLKTPAKPNSYFGLRNE